MLIQEHVLLGSNHIHLVSPMISFVFVPEPCTHRVHQEVCASSSSSTIIPIHCKEKKHN